MSDRAVSVFVKRGLGVLLLLLPRLIGSLCKEKSTLVFGEVFGSRSFSPRLTETRHYGPLAKGSSINNNTNRREISPDCFAQMVACHN